ncbi:MAG TPA: nucleotide exchange factor GrpE [Caulobacteraceae bacterium]|jgi:molecular chaperone GrpE|nr:nucleotide exchange factor GrpE [Caulobacteraceae bacterium]
MTDEADTPAEPNPAETQPNPVDEAETLRAEIAQLKEQMLRVAADAENAKRRAEREANDARHYAIQRFAQDLLGAADNLSRALQAAPRDAAEPALKNLVTGIEMIEKDLISAFDRNGLKRLDPPRGAKFDPHRHQAMMEQPADDVGAGAVLQVMQAGYELHGRLVRPAMVIVSAKGSTGEAPAEPAAANPYAHPDTGAESGVAVDEKA